MSALWLRAVNGDSVPVPWSGRWLEYGFRNGIRIPVHREVASLRPGARPYWRARITAIEAD